MSNNLSELANIYHSDKGEHRLNSKGHNYVKTYEKYFFPLKEKPIAILEIGVREGNSLNMWKDYFPNARIYGFDINPSCQMLSNERIKVLVGDQSKLEDLDLITKLIKERFDIIIDDGSHKSHDIITSLNFLKDYLKPGGYYFIEDMDPNQNKELVKIFINGLRDMRLLEYVISEAGFNEELGVLQKI